jgi:uncharacterized protein (DUF2141 family)
MRTRNLLWPALLASVLAAAAFASADKAEEQRPDGTGAIEVSVAGLRSSEGILFVSLYLTNDGYPGEWQRAYATQQLAAADAVDGVLLARFENVPAGWFVISVLHDEDSNSEMATNAFGMPKEGYGFSKNEKSLFGPPGFDKAAVYLEPGEVQTLSIQLMNQLMGSE